MEVFLNKERIIIPDNTTLGTFISDRKISTTSIAVAVNMKVIKKERWQQTILKQDDKIVIIGATKGG